MAARLAPRAMKVTSSPAAASFVPRYPPMAPAPTTAILIFKSRRGARVAIGQRTDAVDDHLDGGAFRNRPGTDRRAARDDIARQQRHIARNKTHELRRAEDHVAHRIILPLLAVDERAY